METIATTLVPYASCMRTGPFWTLFRNKGYTLEEASLGGRPLIRMTSPEGHRWLTTTNISYPMISTFAQKLAEHKHNMYLLAKESGLQIPATELLTVDQTAHDSQLLSTHAAVVVKPLDSFGSKGLTTNVTDNEALQVALDIARKVSPNVLVQEQVSGDELRFTILEGKVVSVMLRQSARVVGDGSSTIAQLIEKENAHRKTLKFKHITYPQLSADIIDEKWLHNQSVPIAGDVVRLSDATMVRHGASIYDVIEETHESYKKAAERLAEYIGTDFIVVDIFIKEYTQPLATGNYWFNECNTAPALRLFYADKNGRGPNVAEAIVDRMDQMIRGKA